MKHLSDSSTSRTIYSQYPYEVDSTPNSSVYVLIALLKASETEYISPELLRDYAIYTRNRVEMHRTFAATFLA